VRVNLDLRTPSGVRSRAVLLEVSSERVEGVEENHRIWVCLETEGAEV
jgi:hypothetical protein